MKVHRREALAAALPRGGEVERLDEAQACARQPELGEFRAWCGAICAASAVA
jgi:hypothetical protein